MKKFLTIASLLFMLPKLAFAAESSQTSTHDPLAILGILATLLVSIATLIHSLQNDRRASFVNTVTSSRLKWIDSLRDEVAEFIATTTRLANRKDPAFFDEKTEDLLQQRDILVHQIVLHLNPDDPKDQNIRKLTESISQLTNNGGPAEEVATSLSKLRDTTAIYLKKEWTRVKNESVGGGKPDGKD
jgi:hypothetical protein